MVEPDGSPEQLILSLVMAPKVGSNYWRCDPHSLTAKRNGTKCRFGHSKCRRQQIVTFMACRCFRIKHTVFSRKIVQTAQKLYRDPISSHTTVLFATADGGRTWKADQTLRNFVGSCSSSTVVDSVCIAPSNSAVILHSSSMLSLRVTLDAGKDNGSDSQYSTLCGTRLSFVYSRRGLDARGRRVEFNHRRRPSLDHDHLVTTACDFKPPCSA